MTADGSLGKFAIRLLLFGLFAAAGMELFFRVGLHATENPRAVQDPLTGVSRFDTSWIREGRCTSGPLCRPLGRWRINDAGWNSIFDYAPRTDPDRPRIAVLGNSYIEGFASDVDSHLDAELSRLLGGAVDVYAFGISGATFAQYAGMIPGIEREYDPDIYLIMLSSFGIGRSLDAGVSPYRFTVSETDSGFSLRPPREVFVQNRYGRLLFRSALAMYLRLNRNAFGEGLQLAAEESSPPAEGGDSIPARLREAGGFFVETLEGLLPGHPIILFACSGTDQDYRILEPLLAGNPAFTLVDLADALDRASAREGVTLISADGGHWNDAGQRAAASALLPAVRNALEEGEDPVNRAGCPSDSPD